MHFYDTYAFMEMGKGNPAYTPFENQPFITSVMNVGELYVIFLREEGKEAADKWFVTFTAELLEITPEVMMRAVYFRFLNKKKNISLTDAIGYILAIKHMLKFLTGDREFKDLPNVEFVK